MGRAIFGLAGGASIAVTLMACYGQNCDGEDGYAEEGPVGG
jgi:hypothetical protein